MKLRERLEAIRGVKNDPCDEASKQAATLADARASISSRLQLSPMHLTSALGHPREAVASTPSAGPRARPPLTQRLLNSPLAQKTNTTPPQHRSEMRSAPSSMHEIAHRLGGEICADGVVLVRDRIPLSNAHGSVRFDSVVGVSLEFFARGEDPERAGLLFIDTETSGLSGGTGTVAFLLGLARIEAGCIVTQQYCLTSFKGEAAMLDHALSWIDAASHLVSYNGKSFDIPLLVTRYRLARKGNPFEHLGHIDLLHPARTAYGKNWPDCRLQTAEQRLFELHREDDLPGHLIPEVWTSFLRSGDARRLPRIVEHNRLDLLSLIALGGTLARTFAEPGHEYADALAIARAHRRRGDQVCALHHLERPAHTLDAASLLELASLYSRNHRWNEALMIWKALAEAKSKIALEKLAKYFEHGARDYGAAQRYAELLLKLEPSPAHQQRFARLERKRLRQCS